MRDAPSACAASQAVDHSPTRRALETIMNMLFAASIALVLGGWLLTIGHAVLGLGVRK
jgi:hypothetical protein